MIDLNKIDERVALLQEGDSNDEEIDGITEMLRELQAELARIYEQDAARADRTGLAEFDRMVAAESRADQLQVEVERWRGGYAPELDELEQQRERADQLQRERDEAKREHAQASDAALAEYQKRVKAEGRAERAETALREAMDAVIWLTGLGDLTDSGHWQTVRDEQMPRWRAALADSGETTNLHDDRKAAAEAALIEAANDYVWEPKPETMEALTNARGEWQSAVGLWRLADSRETT